MVRTIILETLYGLELSIGLPHHRHFEGMTHALYGLEMP